MRILHTIILVLCLLHLGFEGHITQPIRLLNETTAADFGNHELIGELRSDTTGTLFGYRILPLGDQNDDGFDDVLIYDHVDWRHVAFLYYGGVTPDSIPGLRFDSVNGWRCSDVGDVNGDGYDDLAMAGRSPVGRKLGLYYGGPQMDTIRDHWFGWDSLYGIGYSGYGMDFSGNGIKELVTSSNIFTSVLVFDLGGNVDSVPELIVRPGIEPNDVYVFGEGLITGDFNGDGETDLIVSLRRQPQQHINGSLYMYWGGPGLDTIPDMIIRRMGDWDWGYEEFGQVLEYLGDVNGDEYDDFYAGTGNSADTMGFIYFGGPSIDTLPDVIIAENSQKARLAGDVNDDGYNDLITSIEHAYFGGEVYLYYGGTDMDSVPDIYIDDDDFPSEQDYFGLDCSGVGDFNGDGIDDFAFSAIAGFTGVVYLFAGKASSTDVDIKYEQTLPKEFSLHQNYPNPFNTATSISFDIPKRSHVSLAVYNLLGEEVVTLLQKDVSAGTYRVTWDGTDTSGRPVVSGVYLYRLSYADGIKSKKMLLLK